MGGWSALQSPSCASLLPSYRDLHLLYHGIRLTPNFGVSAYTILSSYCRKGNRSSTGQRSDQYWLEREAVLVHICDQYWFIRRAVLVAKPLNTIASQPQREVTSQSNVYSRFTRRESLVFREKR